jgi:excinuclease ABC subunit B
MGRAARNIDGHIIMYANKMTKSMDAAIKETLRRRRIQEQYNTKHKITPMTISKAVIKSDLPASTAPQATYTGFDLSQPSSRQFLKNRLAELQKEISKAIKKLEFERAMILREQIKELKKQI